MLAVALLVALWLGARLGAWWARRRVVRRLARHRRAGTRGEETAARLLEASGYRIVERQPTAVLRVQVDGVERAFDVRGDFLVRRRRRHYLAEAKGGSISADVATTATRRQLLEYACAFDVTGLLLVDAQEGTIHEVAFPGLRR